MGTCSAKTDRRRSPVSSSIFSDPLEKTWSRGFEGMCFVLVSPACCQTLWRCSPGLSEPHVSSSELVWGKTCLGYPISGIRRPKLEGASIRKAKGGSAGTPRFLFPAGRGCWGSPGGFRGLPAGLCLRKEQQRLFPAFIRARCFPLTHLDNCQKPFTQFNHSLH